MKTIEYVADLNTLWLETNLTLYTKWFPHFTNLGCNYLQILYGGLPK